MSDSSGPVPFPDLGGGGSGNTPPPPALDNRDEESPEGTLKDMVTMPKGGSRTPAAKAPKAMMEGKPSTPMYTPSPGPPGSPSAPSQTGPIT